MCSGAGHTTWLVRGSPIRTPSDQRSVGSSPRLIAASHVLHRLLMPRHPPCALNNLTNTQKSNTRQKPTRHLKGNGSEKMLASTVQFSTNNQPPPPRPHPTRTPTRSRRCETRDGPALRKSPHNRNRLPVPLPQDPTACLRPAPHHRPRSTPA